MGVDYISNYGIGVKIEIPKSDNDDFFVHDYLEELLENTDYQYFDVGSSNYTGGENDFYIKIKNPFENGIDGLKVKFDLLVKFLNENNIKYYGNIDIIGGLCIC